MMKEKCIESCFHLGKKNGIKKNSFTVKVTIRLNTFTAYTVLG